MPANSGPDTDRIRGLFMREWRPSSRPRGVFLLLHGMESHSGWFDDVAGRLVAGGWAVAAFDRSGWGKSPGVRGHLAGYRDFVEETVGIAAELRDRHGPVHLAGMSWGGMAALYLALRRGWLFDSVTLLAPGLAAKKDVGFADKLRVAWRVFRKDPAYSVAPLFNAADFTADPARREDIDADPLRVRRVTASFLVETLKMRRFINEAAGRRRTPPTLCLLAGNDAIIDNGRAAEICGRARAAVETVPDAAHTLVFDHPDAVVRALCAHAESATAQAARPKGRVWIVGGGAVGGAVGSLLAFGGVETGVLVKERHLEALRGGFTLRTGHAARTTGAAAVIAARPEDLPQDPDLVIVAVKSFDTANALRSLRGAFGEATVLTSLQNGLGNEDLLAGAFPGNTIVAGSIAASLELTGPGKIRWADDRGGLAGACHHGDAALAHQIWNTLMIHTGMECRWVDGPKASQRLKWSKLMLNTGFNVLNSATGMTSAELLRDPGHGSLAICALRESFTVMRRLSLDPVDLPGFPVSKLQFAIRAPIGIARKMLGWQAERSEEAAFSMRQDLLYKRQHTEIDELNGIIVTYGHHMSVSVKANEKLVAMAEKTFKTT